MFTGDVDDEVRVGRHLKGHRVTWREVDPFDFGSVCRASGVGVCVGIRTVGFGMRFSRFGHYFTLRSRADMKSEITDHSALSAGV